jgi:hypothetical protein
MAISYSITMLKLLLIIIEEQYHCCCYVFDSVDGLWGAHLMLALLLRLHRLGCLSARNYRGIGCGLTLTSCQDSWSKQWRYDTRIESGLETRNRHVCAASKMHSKVRMCACKAERP